MAKNRTEREVVINFTTKGEKEAMRKAKLLEKQINKMQRNAQMNLNSKSVRSGMFGKQRKSVPINQRKQQDVIARQEEKLTAKRRQVQRIRAMATPRQQQFYMSQISGIQSQAGRKYPIVPYSGNKKYPIVPYRQPKALSEVPDVLANAKKFDFAQKMEGLNKKFLGMFKTLGLTVGVFMMLANVVMQTVSAFNALHDTMAQVDKNVRQSSAFRASMSEPKYFDEAVTRYSDLTGATRGQAGAQLGTILGEFKSAGTSLPESQIKRIAEIAYAYAETSTQEMTPDVAFQRIQGLVTGRTSKTEAGLFKFERAGSITASLDNIEAILKERPLYESVMQGGSYNSINQRGKNAMINTFERMYAKTPQQIKAGAVINTTLKENIMGTSSPETQSGFTKFMNTMAIIQDKLNTFTSPGSGMSKLMEFLARLADIFTDIWIAVEPLVLILMDVVNLILKIVQKVTGPLGRILNIGTTATAEVTGSVETGTTLKRLNTPFFAEDASREKLLPGFQLDLDLEKEASDKKAAKKLEDMRDKPRTNERSRRGVGVGQNHINANTVNIYSDKPIQKDVVLGG